MSDSDAEDKTEEATEKKTRDAIERGDTPMSRDATTFALLIGYIFAASLIWRNQKHPLSDELARLLALCGDLSLSAPNSGRFLFEHIASACYAAFGPALGVLIVCILVTNFAQGLPRFVGKRVKPDVSRISPMAGVKRIFSKKGLIEFGKSFLKISISAYALYHLLKSQIITIADATYQDPFSLGSLIKDISLRLIYVIAGVMGVFAAMDIFLGRFNWKKSLRMTRQEIKDEMKQSEGDPYVKMRMRSLAMDRSRRRMIKDVEKATVVIANPVHYAIALRYVREEGGAPVVIAKGKELIALKIRERAESLGIPVIENPPLARAMYDHVEINAMIPSQFYRAIAEIINYLLSGRSGYAKAV